MKDLNVMEFDESVKQDTPLGLLRGIKFGTETYHTLFMRLCRSATGIVIFTALHGMQTRSSDENSVCPSVTRVNCDKTEEKSVQIFISYDRSFILVF